MKSQELVQPLRVHLLIRFIFEKSYHHNINGSSTYSPYKNLLLASLILFLFSAESVSYRRILAKLFLLILLLIIFHLIVPFVDYLIDENNNNK